jgi:putative methyltransferase (TIGR04325 family)
MRRLEPIREFLRRMSPSKYGWSGDYPGWEAAAGQCSGYAAAAILQKVQESVLKVRSGEFPYERDSVLFDKIEYNWPLLSVLMWVSAQREGQLNVADFGGSLGSSYFQNRLFLDGLRKVSWNVIEQPNFVAAGKAAIEDQRLRFFYTVEEAIKDTGMPDLLLLSCVLPYISEPYELLKQLMKHRLPYILIDNTYFNYEARDRITIQRVPPSIYEASYPCWFLDFERVKACLEKEYITLAEYTNDSFIFLDGKKITYRGIFFKRIVHENHT